MLWTDEQVKQYKEMQTDYQPILEGYCLEELSDNYPEDRKHYLQNELLPFHENNQPATERIFNFVPTEPATTLAGLESKIQYEHEAGNVNLDPRGLGEHKMENALASGDYLTYCIWADRLGVEPVCWDAYEKGRAELLELRKIEEQAYKDF